MEGGLGSPPAMWRIADGGGIEQRDSSFLHQRTHTPDPKRHLGMAEGLRLSAQDISSLRRTVKTLFGLRAPVGVILKKLSPYRRTAFR
jgi:hypothetical protein